MHFFLVLLSHMSRGDFPTEEVTREFSRLLQPGGHSQQPNSPPKIGTSESPELVRMLPDVPGGTLQM